MMSCHFFPKASFSLGPWTMKLTQEGLNSPEIIEYTSGPVHDIHAH